LLPASENWVARETDPFSPDQAGFCQTIENFLEYSFVKRFLIALFVALGLVSVAQAQTAPVAPAAPAVTPDNIWHLQLSTGGEVTIALRPDKAPGHIARVKKLTRSGFYNGLAFHRVIEGFMAQGGDPQGTGEGGSTLPDLKAEFNDLPHVRGAVSAARTNEPNTANSQFFIVFSPTLRLDGKYTVFGRVLSGMAYVDAIERGEPPANPSKILKAWIEADGPNAALVPLTPEVASAVVEEAPAPIPVTEGKKAKKEKKKKEKKRKNG
jgi:cyclophilin family peptidyl-prolyl cis-trans isomerase